VDLTVLDLDPVAVTPTTAKSYRIGTILKDGPNYVGARC
jgi:hypothetical protein